MNILFNLYRMSSFPIYSQIAIINKSTVVSDEDGSNMTAALNELLPIFCKDWSIPIFTAIYFPKETVVFPSNLYLVYLLDTSGVEGSLAYHDLSLDIPYANVFTKSILSNDGVMLYEPTLNKPTVAQTLAHEVFELIIDPRSNTWWMNCNTGQLHAAKVCDPVQSNIVAVTLNTGVNVGMSDWILPSWQDAQNTTGPFNHNNTLTMPFEIKK